MLSFDPDSFSLCLNVKFFILYLKASLTLYAAGPGDALSSIINPYFEVASLDNPKVIPFVLFALNTDGI